MVYFALLFFSINTDSDVFKDYGDGYRANAIVGSEVYYHSNVYIVREVAEANHKFVVVISNLFESDKYLEAMHGAPAKEVVKKPVVDKQLRAQADNNPISVLEL